jgi:hypothetical protein
MKVIKDKDLSENLNIPSSTLQDWKKTEDGNWRNKIYNFLKDNFNPDLLKKNRKISYRQVMQSSHMFAVNKLLGKFEKDELEIVKNVFENFCYFDLYKFDEISFKLRILEVLQEIQEMQIDASVKIKINQLIIEELDFNSYVIIYSYFFD